MRRVLESLGFWMAVRLEPACQGGLVNDLYLGPGYVSLFFDGEGNYHDGFFQFGNDRGERFGQIQDAFGFLLGNGRPRHAEC